MNKRYLQVLSIRQQAHLSVTLTKVNQQNKLKVCMPLLYNTLRIYNVRTLHIPYPCPLYIWPALIHVPFTHDPPLSHAALPMSPLPMTRPLHMSSLHMSPPADNVQ